jgi:thiamine biosynthesis lipoprotein
MRPIHISGILILFAIGCTTKPMRNYTKIEGFTQGTTYSITYFDSLARDFSPQFDSILQRVDGSMSIYNPNSTISKLNRNELDVIDPMLAEVITVARGVWANTDGAFDITVRPLVKLFGFGPEKVTHVDTARIRELLPYIGMEKVHLEGNRVIKAHPQVQLDVNAIAQGYTVDVLGRFLESRGISHYLVEVGGELCSRGVNSRGVAWVVGVDKPVENAIPGENIQTKIKLSGKGLATSGNYRKFFVDNGVKYSHTINPKTGYPAQQSLLSATVVASNATVADAMATAFMVMGLDKAKSYLLNHPELDAYLIYCDAKGEYQVWMTDRMKALVFE